MRAVWGAAPIRPEEQLAHHVIDLSASLIGDGQQALEACRPIGKGEAG